MTYISQQFQTEVVLPDGTAAACVHDIDQYLRRSGTALAGDYSPAYLKQVKQTREQEQRQKLFAEFIHNYKRKIWYEK